MGAKTGGDVVRSGWQFVQRSLQVCQLHHNGDSSAGLGNVWRYEAGKRRVRELKAGYTGALGRVERVGKKRISNG